MDTGRAFRIETYRTDGKVGVYTVVSENIYEALEQIVRIDKVHPRDIVNVKEV